MQSIKHKFAQLKIAALLLLCALSVMGCATTSQNSASVLPVIPARPELSEPMPSQSYSISAQELLKTWRAKLKAMPTTP